MGSVTKLFVAPVAALQQIADSSSAQFPSSGATLEYLSEIALVRLQALIDGITGWDEHFDAVAIQFESEPYAESRADDGGWSRMIPERSIRSIAALIDADINRLAAVWGHPDTHAGQTLSLADAAAMIRAVRDISLQALTQGSAVIFSTHE